MQLAVPLVCKQVHAANRLHSHLQQWQITDCALESLARHFPGFDAEACVLKVASVNALYGTNLYAVVRMAHHIEIIMADAGACEVAVALVERIAALPKTEAEKTSRVHLSFASKFAHFFVDGERFPILDSYAERTLRLHLGKCQVPAAGRSRYATFVEDLGRLKSLSGWTGSCRHLDQYLWLAGQYLDWLHDPKAKINAEVSRLFINPPDQVRDCMQTAFGCLPVQH